MGCGDEKLSKSLTQTFTAHCNALICQQVTLSGDAEWPKVADAVIEALAQPNTIAVSEATYRLVQGYFDCKALGEQTLRGVAEPLNVYRVLRESGVHSRLD